MDNVRTPDEIKTLYKRLRKKHKREGKEYLKKDFLDDIGYNRQSGFAEITTGKKGISIQTNKLMDHLEDTL